MARQGGKYIINNDGERVRVEGPDMPDNDNQADVKATDDEEQPEGVEDE